MNQPISIDRLVDDAIALAELKGMQTGTAPAPRVPRYDAPADQPPLALEGEEEDRRRVPPILPLRGILPVATPTPATPIQRLHALRWLAQDFANTVNNVTDPDVIEATDPGEKEIDALCEAMAAADYPIHRLPASNWADVICKIELWGALADEDSDLNAEDHVPALQLLLEDIQHLAASH